MNEEHQGIAIVGIAAQLPAGFSSVEDLDYASFWDFLVKGKKHMSPWRISYLIVSRPSVQLDTACSSSLTALHLAITAIEKGDCIAALVGAAQINRDFGRGEGAVVIVIKSLKEARRSNDHIYSVILGSAVNATGSNMPLSVPSGHAQQRCIEEAYRRSGLSPRDADYIELHATGTTVGDPIEGNAHFAIFQGEEQGSPPVPFGTVKGNIGHLEVAAFLGSLVKACLMFEHISSPNRNPTALGCRSSSGRPIISLSGSGLGGTTGHVVLQAPPTPSSNVTQVSVAPTLFLVGGLSSSAVDQISQMALQLAAEGLSIRRECAVTLSRRARQLPWRTYFTHPPGAIIPPATLIPREYSPLIFVFSVSLIETTGLFAVQLARSQSTPPLIPLPDSGWPITITLSAIAMVQMAMVDLLKSIGIVPDMMMGHSAGETAILYASGAGTKQMAMEIAIARGEAMTCTESLDFGMAILGCSSERASELMARVSSGTKGILELACFNTADSIAISGTATLLDAVVALGQREGLFAQRVRTMVPGHSSFMDCIKGDYLEKMNNIFSRYAGTHAPQIPVISTCRQEKFVDVFSASYFWDNCRNAVLFNDAISLSLESLNSSPIFLEISCHPVLSSSIMARGVPENRVLCPMHRISPKKTLSVRSNEPGVFLDTLGRLSLLGLNSMDLSGLYGFSAFKSKLINHPLTARVIPRRNHTLSSPFRPQRIAASFRLRILASTVIVIRTWPNMLSTLLEAGANFLWDVEFMGILSLASTSPLEVGLQRLDSAWSVTTNTGRHEREHARGFMDKSAPNEPPPAIDLRRLGNVFVVGLSRSGLFLSSKKWPLMHNIAFYRSIEPLVSYGPRFQRIVRCHGGPLEAIAEIREPTPDEKSERYLLHPAAMDACLHVMMHKDISRQEYRDIMYIPSRLEHFIFYRREYGAGNWFSHIRLNQWTPDSRCYDIMITDSFGLALCELRNLTVVKFSSVPPVTVNCRFDVFFQPVAVNVDIPTLGDYFPERTDKPEIQLLYSVLDSLAFEMISKSLAQEVVVGADDSRHRYLAFARRALGNFKEMSLAPETMKNLRDKWPHHFEITSRIASVHEFVFDKPLRAVDALYSDGLMAKFYSKSSQTSNVCLEATKAFSGVLDSMRKSGKRSIRILEIGAGRYSSKNSGKPLKPLTGTGLLTYHLIGELKQNPDLLVEYTVSDISYADNPSFVASQLVADLARNIPHGSVIPKAYDISKDPEEQGMASDAYDFVVGLHVLHTAPNVEACLCFLQN
ncbi:hypothetical protein B0H13DRAFT_2272842 [Mycena leptocephala]|nr:hypothetical protein B0H13DRAFT_2272842 [Mycena leptocephala]